MRAYFQEYDPEQLNQAEHGDFIIQRTLEFEDWEDLRWLFDTYGSKRIRLFIRQRGERWLRPPVFNFWRKLLRIRKWEQSPFPIAKGDLWKF
jgi:hypothetical protein